MANGGILHLRALVAALAAAGATFAALTASSAPIHSQGPASETPQANLPIVMRAQSTPTPTATEIASPTPTHTPTPAVTVPPGTNRSLRFFGNGVAAPGQDRVEIPLGNPSRPVNVGNGDFTIEFWMKAALSDNNNGHQCTSGNDSWIRGHIVIDRDVFGAGDYGDYGISLASGRVAFGVNNGSSGVTVCGTASVADSAWHHVAVQRRLSDGMLWVFVDGVLQAQVDGPNGRIDYRAGRTGVPDDPFLVFGAEKHDAGAEYPSYSGFLEEVRISRILRYSGNFTRPGGPFAPDANTAALYRFNEASGTAILDASGAAGGPSNGVMNVGGNPAGPARSTDVPW